MINVADRLRPVAGNAGGGSGGWDLANAALISIPAASFTTSARGFFISPSGENMYAYHTSGEIRQYTLTTPWDISTYVYSQSTPVYTQESSPQGLSFKPDGLSMYVVGTSTDTVYQYTLTTAWDVSTASYSNTSFSVAAQETNPQALFFKPDGLAMYVIGTTGDSVYQYTLTTAWDVSTASYANKSFSVAAQEGAPQGLSFKPDGLSMYVLGSATDTAYQYTLTTEWDVSTASYSGTSFSVAAQSTNPYGLFFKPDGLSMYVPDGSGGQTLQYTLTTEWDVSTANFPRAYFAYVGSQEANPQDLAFSPDGLSMYVIGSAGDEVNQFTLTTALDVSTATVTRVFSVRTQDTTPNALFFKPDGLAMYMVGSSTDTVYQYTITDPWNLSTASYANKSFSVAAQEANPQALFFKPDGLAMYVMGSSGDDVNQYTLTTAWDVSTASYANKSFSVAAQDSYPAGLFFKPDGLAMYVVGAAGDAVYQYTLTTAWDVSTASYLQNFVLVAQNTNPTGICFNTDGTLMFAVDSITRTVWTYSL